MGLLITFAIYITTCFLSRLAILLYNREEYSTKYAGLSDNHIALTLVPIINIGACFVFFIKYLGVKFCDSNSGFGLWYTNPTKFWNERNRNK